MPLSDAPRTLVMAVFALCVMVPARAAAQGATVALAVTRDAASEVCPSREVLVSQLRARLGRDALDDRAPTHITLRFARRGPRWTASLRMAAPRGRVTHRTLQSADARCDALGHAVTLVLALTIDPTRARSVPEAPVAPIEPVPVAPPPAPAAPVAPPTAPSAPAAPAQPAPAPTQPAPAPAPPAPAPAQPAPPPAQPAPTRWTLSLAALATLSSGLAPGLDDSPLRPGITVRAALRRGPFAMAFDLAVDVPGTLSDPRWNASIDAFPVALTAAFCGGFGARPRVDLCATLTGALVTVWGRGYAVDATDLAGALAVGLRAAVTVPFAARWALVASAEGRGLAVRPAVTLDGDPRGSVFTASALAATLAVGVQWTIR